jgi:hypothetical protein
MYQTQIRIRIWSPATHIYVQKWLFWPPKHCCPSRAQWKKTYCLILNVMILQMVRNECVRFGKHVDIEVSYKILWLEITIHFTRDWFEAVLAKNTWGSLGINKSLKCTLLYIERKNLSITYICIIYSNVFFIYHSAIYRLYFI